MKKRKISKSGAIVSAIIAVVLLILLNLVTFVIPFNICDLTTHYTVYAFSTFVLVVESALIISQLFLEDDANAKIIGLPILYYGFILFGIQLLLTIIFFVVNAFVVVPFWVVIILEAFIVGFGIIQIAKGFFFKHRNKEYHENIADTSFMDGFRAKVKVLHQINKCEECDSILEDLVDVARGSDPSTNDLTEEIEAKINVIVAELDAVVRNGNAVEIREVTTRVKDALIERNALCKAGK